jgi:glyoxylase-like metal-dependent hydrolase (beta-lactamase superfamily II)
MTLEIIRFMVGPMQNNTYLAADSETGQAVIIDPSTGTKQVWDEAVQHGWTVNAVWLTHAHFDHISGIREILDAEGKCPQVRVHPADIPLYQSGGGAGIFGVDFHPAEVELTPFDPSGTENLGKYSAKIRPTPGHTPGHVLIYLPDAGAAFTGDLIFYESVGRTDLAGGDWRKLLNSIESQVLTLPDETRLLPGHGEETSVSHERMYNPFLQ